MNIINYVSFLIVFKDKYPKLSFLKNKCSWFQSRNNLFFLILFIYSFMVYFKRLSSLQVMVG